MTTDLLICVLAVRSSQFVVRLSGQRGEALDSVTEALRLRPDSEGAQKELSLLKKPADSKGSPRSVYV